jgi:hypothetical protein
LLNETLSQYKTAQQVFYDHFSRELVHFVTLAFCQTYPCLEAPVRLAWFYPTSGFGVYPQFHCWLYLSIYSAALLLVSISQPYPAMLFARFNLSKLLLAIFITPKKNCWLFWSLISTVWISLNKQACLPHQFNLIAF